MPLPTDPPLMLGLGRDYAGTLPEEMFVSGHRESLQCMVCQVIPCQPLRCKGSCGHLWCQDCAKGWLVDQKKTCCPTCKDDVQGLEGLWTGFGAAWGELMDMAVIRCPYTPSGCQVEGTLDAVVAHVDSGSGGCGHRVVNCGLGLCGEKVHLKDLKSHHDQCPHRTVVCGDCMMKMPCHAIQPHIDQECLEKVVGCPLACGELVLRRRELADHRGECSQEVIQCPLCPSMVQRCQLEQHLTQDPAHIPPLLRRIEALEQSLKAQGEVVAKSASIIRDLQSKSGLEIKLGLKEVDEAVAKGKKHYFK